MLTALLMWLIKVAIICLIAYVVIYIMNAFLPIPPAIKHVIGLVIWAIVGIAAIMWLIPIVNGLDGALNLSLASIKMLV